MCPDSSDYAEIPVLLRLEIPTQGTVTPAFLVGPVVGFNTSAFMLGLGVPLGQ